MAAVKNAAKPKCRPLSPGKRKQSSQWNKTAVSFLCLMAFIQNVAVSESVSVKRFTCMDDLERCRKVLDVFDSVRDINLYSRHMDKALPQCTAVSPLAADTCSVCCNQTHILIDCSDEVRAIDVEDSEGTVLTVSAVKQISIPNSSDSDLQHRSRFGLILSLSLFGLCVCVF